MKINPFEIEKIILEDEHVEAAYAKRIPDVIYGENFNLEVIANADYHNSIVQYINSTLTAYYRPKKIKFVNAFESTITGKIKR